MREEIVQAIRAWYVAALGLSAEEGKARIIPADDPGPRPVPPFVTVAITAERKIAGEDRENASGRKARTVRWYSVAVMACGREAEDWHLEAQTYAEQRPPPVEFAAITLSEILTAGQYVPALLDTDIETRILAEYAITAEAIATTARTITAARYLQVATTLESDTASDITDTITVDTGA